MVFRFCPQVLEDDLLHESLHQVPVLHYPVTDGPLETRRENKSQSLWSLKSGKSIWLQLSHQPLSSMMVCRWPRPRWRSPGRRRPSSSCAGPGLPPWPTPWLRYLQVIETSEDTRSDSEMTKHFLAYSKRQIQHGESLISKHKHYRKFKNEADFCSFLSIGQQVPKRRPKTKRGHSSFPVWGLNTSTLVPVDAVRL